MEKDIERQILKQLEEYGDSVLEPVQYKKKTKKNRTKIPDSEEQTTSKNVIMSRRLKKKMKQKQNKKEVSNSPQQLSCNMLKKKRVKSKKKQMKLLQLEVENVGQCVTEKKSTNSDFLGDKSESFPNKCSTISVKRKLEPEVVIFQSKKKKDPSTVTSRNSKIQRNNESAEPECPEFDLRQARYDVQKFGIKGLDSSKREEAMTSLLVKLGAKPPKNKYINYREYQDKVKKEAEEKRNKKDLDRKLGFKVVSSNRKDKKRTKDKNDVGKIDGQVGKYRSGVLFVKKQELVGFKKTKTIK